MDDESKKRADLAVTNQLGLGAVANGVRLARYILELRQTFLARIDDVLRPFDLSHARWSALLLLTLDRKEGMTLGTLSGMMGVHPGTITKAMMRLEADGLATRTPHPSNGRIVLAVITPAGLKLVRKASKAVETVLAKLELPDDELETYYRLSERIDTLLTA